MENCVEYYIISFLLLPSSYQLINDCNLASKCHISFHYSAFGKVFSSLITESTFFYQPRLKAKVITSETGINIVEPTPINSRLNVLVRSQAPLGWVEMAVGLPEGPSYPEHSPFIFSLCCPLNDRRRAAHSIFKIGRLFSLFLLSCPTLSLLLRLLILLLLLMSGNVHPNPGPIFPCSVCARNVTWRGKSVQCCTCSKWVHLKFSQLSLSNFRALGSSHSWSFPPAITL